MTEAAKNAKKQYMKKWRDANPEKVKKHQEDYWERKAAEAELKKGVKDDRL